MSLFKCQDVTLDVNGTYHVSFSQIFGATLAITARAAAESPGRGYCGAEAVQKLVVSGSGKPGFSGEFRFCELKLSLSTILTKTLECFRLGHLRIECISNVTVIVKAQKDNFNFDEKHF